MRFVEDSDMRAYAFDDWHQRLPTVLLQTSSKERIYSIRPKPKVRTFLIGNAQGLA
jgi:hypothetical protein